MKRSHIPKKFIEQTLGSVYRKPKKMPCHFMFKKLTYCRSNVIKSNGEITNTTKVHRTNS